MNFGWVDVEEGARSHTYTLNRQHPFHYFHGSRAYSIYSFAHGAGANELWMGRSWISAFLFKAFSSRTCKHERWNATFGRDKANQKCALSCSWHPLVLLSASFSHNILPLVLCTCLWAGKNEIEWVDLGSWFSSPRFLWKLPFQKPPQMVNCGNLRREGRVRAEQAYVLFLQRTLCSLCPFHFPKYSIYGFVQLLLGW